MSLADLHIENAPRALQLRVEDLAADAGPLRLFSELSFTLGSGEALILRGPNGVGKTTVLRMIAGLYPRASGRIIFSENAANELYKIGENCHFLGHKNGLKTGRSLRQNLEFLARFEGVSKDAIERATAELSLTPLMDLPVGLLSAGQARRAACARLLIAPRAVWLLDEPSAALDDMTTRTLETLCRAHIDGGGLLIVSTHLPFLAGLETAQHLDLAAYSAASS